MGQPMFSLRGTDRPCMVHCDQALALSEDEEATQGRQLPADRGGAVACLMKALEEVLIKENGKSLLLRTESIGTCGRLFQAVGVAIPPTIREA